MGLLSSIGKFFGIKKDKKDKGGIVSPTGTGQYKAYEKHIWDKYHGRIPELQTGALEKALALRSRKMAESSSREAASAASARGLGRSSLISKQIGDIHSQYGMDLAERLAQLDIEKQREKMRQREEGAVALKGAGELSANIANQVAAQNQMLAEKARTEQLAGLQRLATTVGGAIVGGVPGAIAGVGGMSLPDITSSISVIDKILKGRGATVPGVSPGTRLSTIPYRY